MMNLDKLLTIKEQSKKPVVVCLCGSTRFGQAFQDANLFETLAGRIVLSIGCNTKSDEDLIKAGAEIDKEALDLLHFYKIDMADEVLILNVGGYVGESTMREIEYAYRLKKRIRWLEPQHALTETKLLRLMGKPLIWEGFAWPDWVPGAICREVMSFYKWHGGYQAWLESAKQKCTYSFGEIVSLKHMRPDIEIGYLDEHFVPCPPGKFVFAWNNIGRVVYDDGSYTYVSF